MGSRCRAAAVAAELGQPDALAPEKGLRRRDPGPGDAFDSGAGFACGVLVPSEITDGSAEDRSLAPRR